MIFRAFLAAAVALVAIAGGVASAHQQKAALTEVLFNPRTGNIEVAHRFALHDAEHAVRIELGVDGDLYTTPETRAAFASYVAKHFSLATPDGAPLPLALLGVEISDGHLWVYQETPAPDAIDALVVRCGALRDIWPDQINRVNVKRGDDVRTLVFTGAVGELVATLQD